jgi:hypothetical protein
MNADTNNKNWIIEINESDSLFEGFDIEDGLLGIKQDRFLLLLKHMYFESTDNKTRNV